MHFIGKVLILHPKSYNFPPKTEKRIIKLVVIHQNESFCVQKYFNVSII